MIHKVIIIGGGCAGLTAAIYCARAMMEPIVFADNLDNKGGLLVKISVVENYPGFATGINGFDLVNNMEQQAILYGARIINTRIESVDFSKRPFILIDSTGTKYRCQSVIICTEPLATLDRFRDFANAKRQAASSLDFFYCYIKDPVKMRLTALR